MDVNTLLEVVETRIQVSENNPTAKSFLHEIYNVLQDWKDLKQWKETNKRLVYAEDVVEQIDQWLDSVGDVIVGKGLSYYGELMGCIEDAPTVELAAIYEHEKLVKELQFTRDFIHRHGLTFELASEWERKKK